MAADWCRACGAEGRTGACAACGVPGDRPHTGEPRVGRVVRVGRALRARPGVVLATDANGVMVLTKGTEPAPVPAEEFANLPPVDVGGPQVGGAAGRLMLAAQALRAGTLKAKWDAEAVQAAAMSHAAAGLGARRGAALDALALGLDAIADGLGLSATETAWYRAWSATVAGDAGLALHWMERLPPESYAGKVRLLARCAPALLRDAGLSGRATALLVPLAGRVEEARVLMLALAPTAPPDAAGVLEAAASGFGERERGIAAALVKGTPPPAPPPPDLRLVRAFAGYLAGRTPGAVVDTDELVPLPVPLLDELADLRTLGGPPTSPEWPRRTAAHLACRLDPGRASAQDLVDAGFTAERARRAYLAGDEAALAGLPDGDPAVRHYRALLRSRAAGEPSGADDLRPDARKTLAEVAELRSRTGRGQKAMVSPELAADASCRRLLREPAGRGLLRPPAGLDAHSPFGLWRDLCVLERRALDGEWDDVVPRGTEIAARVGGPLREEALNMVAYARLRTGHRGAALRTLDDALADRRPTGLLVNASVVAAADGTDRAVGYLRELFRTTPDEEVARGAVLRAIGLWRAEEDRPEYPPELRGLLREALLLPEEDDEHQRVLLAVAAMNDSGWLAGTDEIPVKGAAQRDALTVQQTRARFLADGYDTSYEDLAKALVKLPAYDWRGQEIRAMANLLDSMIHVPFGEAAHLFPVVDTLARAGVLDLAEEIVLSVQAGAHLAAKFAEEGATLKEEAERRLLVKPAEKYLARAAELGDAARAVVGDEAGRCVAVAAGHLGIVVEQQMSDFGEGWNGLVDREAWDYQNRYPIRNQKIAMLRETQSAVDRLLPYIQLLGRLPLDEAAQEKQRLVVRSHRDWNDELQRLRRGM